MTLTINETTVYVPCKNFEEAKRFYVAMGSRVVTSSTLPACC